MRLSDPYSDLGVASSATQDEIKAAYRNIAKKYHPDLNPGNKTAEAKFKVVAAAYERIGTDTARAKFDRGETPEQQQEQAQSYRDAQQERGRYSNSYGRGMGGEEFFEGLFRSAGQGRTRHQSANMSQDLSGEDRLYQMSVDLKDAALGAEREITLPNGKTLQIKIPSGVETGTKLRFKNQGTPGIGKGQAGDAYIEITVRSLDGFTRVGSNIETELSISFIEALLGAEIKVPTIDANVMLKIPPGVTTGSRLRVFGKGVALKHSRGDQIVVLKVVMPLTPNSELQELIRGWGDKYSYNPRVYP